MDEERAFKVLDDCLLSEQEMELGKEVWKELDYPFRKHDRASHDYADDHNHHHENSDSDFSDDTFCCYVFPPKGEIVFRIHAKIISCK